MEYLMNLFTDGPFSQQNNLHCKSVVELFSFFYCSACSWRWLQEDTQRFEYFACPSVKNQFWFRKKAKNLVPCKFFNLRRSKDAPNGQWLLTPQWNFSNWDCKFFLFNFHFVKMIGTCNCSIQYIFCGLGFCSSMHKRKLNSLTFSDIFLCNFCEIK